MKPSLQTSILQAVCGALTILALVTVFMRKPLLFVKFMQFVGIGGGVTCLILEKHREYVETGEEEKAFLESEWNKLDAAKDEFSRWQQNQRVQWERIKEKEADRLNGELQIRVRKLQSEWKELDQMKTLLVQREDRVNTILETIGEREAALIALKATLEAFQAELEHAEEKLNQKLGIEVQRLTNEKNAEICLARQEIMKEAEALYLQVMEEQEVLRIERASFLQFHETQMAEIEAAKRELQNMEKIRLEKFKEHQSVIDDALTTAREEAIALAMSEWQKRSEQQEHLFEVLEQTIRSQQAHIEGLLGGRLKAPPEKGMAGLLADKVVKLIRDDLGIPCYYHDCAEITKPGSDKPAYAIWLRRGDGVRVESYVPLKKTIEQECGLGTCTMSSVRGYVLLTFGDGSHYIDALPLEKPQRGRKAAPEGQIREPNPATIAGFIRQLRHLAVLAPSGLGKSTLVRNLANAKVRSLGGLTKVDININDIKHPDEDAPWILMGQKFKPQYHEYQDVDDDSYIGIGCEDMAEFFAKRSAKKKRDDDQHRAISKFKESFWFVEEAPSVLDKLKVLGSAPLKYALRVSRTLQGNIWLVSQTERCSDLGLKKPDMLNMTRIYIGFETILSGLSEISLEATKKAQILADLYVRQQLAESQIEEGTVNKDGIPPAAYCALVRTTSGMVFLWTLPAPGAWESIPIPEEEGDSTKVSCLDEELTPLSSHEIWAHIQSELDEDEKEGTLPVLKPPTKPQVELSPLEQRIIDYVSKLKADDRPTFGQMTARSKGIRNAFKDEGIDDRPVKAEDVEQACRNLVAKNIGQFFDAKRFVLTSLPEEVQEAIAQGSPKKAPFQNYR